MAIPDFNEFGLLPDGNHPATREEIALRYFHNPNRAAIWQGLELFLAELSLVSWYSCVHSILIDGGFTSDKVHTKDVDIVLDISSASDEQLYEVYFWHGQEHKRVAQKYNVDMYPYHPKMGPNNDFRAFFSYIKQDELIQRNAPSDVRKGMLIFTP